MFQGGPGFSSVAFDGNRVAAGFSTAYWWPQDNATATQQYALCNAEIAAQVGSNAVFFSTHHSALDYINLFGLLRAGNQVAKLSLYCLSYGTFFCQMILNHFNLQASLPLPLSLPAYATPPDAVALDGPVPADRWRLEDSAAWNSVVAGDNLRVCTTVSAACQAHFWQWGHIPRLVMDAIIDGTLPCLRKPGMSWLTQKRVANLNANFELGGASNTFIHAGPFWWRLYRCSDSDAAQLTYYNNVRLANEAANSISNPARFSYGLAAIVGANDVYSSAPTPLTYAQQVSFTARAFADASPQLILSFFRETGVTYTPPAATYRRIPTATMPVLIADATLDPNTAFGLGVWLKNAMSGGIPPTNTNVQLMTVPFSWHGTLDPDQPCAANVRAKFLLAFGALIDLSNYTGFLASLPPPDYDGNGTAAQLVARVQFNAPNLWNDAAPITPFPSPSAFPSAAPSAAPPAVPPAIAAAAAQQPGFVGAVVVLAFSTVCLAASSIFFWRRGGGSGAGAGAGGRPKSWTRSGSASGNPLSSVITSTVPTPLQ